MSRIERNREKEERRNSFERMRNASVVSKVFLAKEVNQEEISRYRALDFYDARRIWFKDVWDRAEMHLPEPVKASVDFFVRYQHPDATPDSRQRLLDKLLEQRLTPTRACDVVREVQVFDISTPGFFQDSWCRDHSLPLLCSDELRKRAASGEIFDVKEKLPEYESHPSVKVAFDRMMAKEQAKAATTSGDGTQRLPEVSQSFRDKMGAREVFAMQRIADSSVRALSDTKSMIMSFDLSEANELAHNLGRSHGLG